MRTYAIGDIHGQLDLLKAAHHRIAADQARHGAAPIVHIGDLVDRGPDSPGVIEYLMAGHARGEDWVTLLGNHDRMFAGYLRDLHWRDPRLRVDLSYLHPKIGGAVTLSNYGVKNPADRPLPPVHAEAVAAVPRAHRDFIESLPTSFARGEAFFAHAGILGQKLGQQNAVGPIEGYLGSAAEESTGKLTVALHEGVQLVHLGTHLLPLIVGVKGKALLKTTVDYETAIDGRGELPLEGSREPQTTFVVQTNHEFA